MAIRINSGWCRGLTLRSPSTLHTRPTASRTREAVWNSLQFELQDSVVIDLFSGSGAVGLEAISRGAQELSLVDISENAVSCLNYNIKMVLERAKHRQHPPQLKVFRQDGLEFLRSHQPLAADLIWLDPPYQKVPSWGKPLGELAARVLKVGGKLVFEYDELGYQDVEAIRHSGEWQEWKHKRYGKTYITILEKLGSES